MAKVRLQTAISERFLNAQDRLVLQSSDMSLETISKMVDSDAIDIGPKYQRRERWSTDRQSALIESFLLNVPIPPVYLSEDDFGIYSVIDGKQRITAIHRFMTDELCLRDLETFIELQGLHFSDLPREPQNALRVRPYLRVVTLLKQSDPLLKYEVFTRLNRGGEPLNAQEIRNVIFRGKLNDKIYSLSTHPFLKKQLKIRDTKGAAYQKMQDAEFVLRFLTLFEIWDDFSGDYRRSMDMFMRDNATCTSKRIAFYSKAFKRSLEACEAIWGTTAFKRPTSGGWRDQLLAGMYDAQMIATWELDDDALDLAISKKSKIKTATRSAFDDPIFEDAVRTATNTPTKVRYRIKKIVDVLKDA
jgi:uncharacterized protein DUF262